MNFKQAFKIAAKSIAAKKGRSALTMLGIIIGLAAVIALVSFAQGQNKWINDYYASLGDNTINISASTWDGRDISEKLYSYCQKMDEYILGVTPNYRCWGDINVKYGAKTLSTYNSDWDAQPQVTLGNQQFTLCLNYELEKGRGLSYLDIKNLNQVCVLGSKLAKNLFNYADPVGETITINGTPLTVVGVYKECDPQNFNNKDNVLLLPYTLKRLFSDQVDTGSFVAKARDANSVTMAISLVNGYLPGLVGQTGWGYAESPNTWQDQSNEQNRMQQMFLGGIAAISLLVGGIGIMNIMLVTVTERTREIGIRKAIGAERKSIIAQFLIEACLICGLGGIIGIAIGYLATAILCKLVLGFIVWPSVTVTMGAFAFSVAMGIIFGLYPAVKASGLQPVEALRAE
ncbi:MAG: ABC transporter permease [Clostridiales bacterium]|nr:ABC transporter permease [Clostridiales bacterium]